MKIWLCWSEIWIYHITVWKRKDNNELFRKKEHRTQQYVIDENHWMPSVPWKGKDKIARKRWKNIIVWADFLSKFKKKKKKKKKKNTGQDVSHYVQNKLLTDIVLKDTMKSSMKSMKSSKNSFHVITADEYIDV